MRSRTRIIATSGAHFLCASAHPLRAPVRLVDADGNCLYHADASVLGPGHDPVQLRASAVRHMGQHRGKFKPSAADRGLSWDDFLEDAGTDGATI